MRRSQRHDARPGAALTSYNLRLGRLVERHMAEAALIAARQEAEREAQAARHARLQMEDANVALKEEVAIRSKTQQRLFYLASHDPLTALANRSLFSDLLAREMADALRLERRLALLYIDLDNFKSVNDTLGHAHGDSLLRHVASRIESELTKGETAARMGGDEFAVLQGDVDQPGEAKALADRLVASLARPFEVDGRRVLVSASVGITLFPDDATEVEPLHRNADLAMYKSKGDGGSRSSFFEASLNAEMHRRSFLEQALREPALLSQLKLMYQPQVDVRTHYVTGVEALLRWQHPEHGLIGPAEFIPLAERSEVINDIGLWVLRESCRQAARWRDAGVAHLTVAVNVATSQFRGGNMPQLVANVLAETGLPASWLELEITETGIMHNMHVAADTLVALHQQGVTLAIDDFGTGYSSLSYLRKLPVDRIKIDQSFVNDVTSNEDAALVATTIVQLAHNLRLQVVAEGVETRAQADFVRDTGCTFAQGFYYGHPATPADLPGLIGRPAPLEFAPMDPAA
jgi:diguanylate cyclase (GGDEF)-like protein